MPWALSLTGPKVSIATMTPTVVSRPVPARAMRNRDRKTETPPRVKARKTAPAMISVVKTADSRPRPMPESTTVAAPVVEASATSLVGRLSVPV